MATLPTAKLIKDEQIIIVNMSDIKEWEGRGFKPVQIKTEKSVDVKEIVPKSTPVKKGRTKKSN